MHYTDNFKQFKYKDMHKSYPLLQEKVYKTLLALTPTQLQFEMNCQLQADPDLKFCWAELTKDTYHLVGAVLAELIEDPKLIITTHDLMISWLRFKELLYTQELLRQGIIKEEVVEDGSVVYVSANLPEPDEVPVKRKFWGRVKPGNISG